jgi:hypothetical protein
MVKNIILAFVLLISVGPNLSACGILTRADTRDSLSIPFQVLDSIGNAVDLAAGDSVYVTVISPGGTVVFADSMAYDDPSIVAYIWEDFAGGSNYAYTERVAVLDGSSSSYGVYSYVLVIDDNTGADLTTSYTGSFQIVPSTLDASLDSIGLAARFSEYALDSLAKTIDSLESLSDHQAAVLDSLAKIIDSLESQSTWVGTLRGDSTEEVVFRRLALRADGGDTALVAHSSGSGIGVFISADSAEGATVSGSTNFPDIIAHIQGTITVNDTNASGASLAVTAEHWSAEDSTAYQGEAAGLTEESLVDAFWDEPQYQHTTPGTFGRFLDTEISGLGAGSGLYAYSLIVLDSSNGLPITYARLALRNLSQTALAAVGLTDNDGRAAFQLDADSFLAVAAVTGYVFPGYDTIVVEGQGVDTLFGYAFDPGQPAIPGLCRVHGYVADLHGNPEEDAAVSAQLPRGVVRSGNLVVSPFSVTTVTDSTGYFYLDLIPSDSLTGPDTRYEIAISRPDGAILRALVTVPAQPQWLLTW